MRHYTFKPFGSPAYMFTALIVFLALVALQFVTLFGGFGLVSYGAAQTVHNTIQAFSGNIDGVHGALSGAVRIELGLFLWILCASSVMKSKEALDELFG